MRKNKLLSVAISAFLLCIIPIEYFPKSITISDSSELNWYYAPTEEKNAIPDPPKESSSFLEENDAYFLGDTSSKTLYLTFDEGYEKGYTGKILDILKTTEVPAAFFVVKPYIEGEPELINRMVSEGHLVCNHTSHHPSMASIHDNEKFKSELIEVENAFKDLTGEEMPKFFRPPMGKYSKDSLEKTKSLGYKTIFWSFAYKDWITEEQPSESYAIEKIESKVHPGAIILLHAVSETNTNVLEKVIKDLKEQGYEFKSLNELPE
ncbi:peptidoglycan-N-acetylmuramic acid deacetylase [Clostridium sp. DSM 8431]|uniref:delta-lactam-biosynthetic de-N-acetylase n=1 Tax=Clostridium sp. DSM 8431 TaxID=1761781 RepID=UPI0008EF6F34|nr:delta-lactam-biosynthetic de-N-acetylase [Clostridium sp. DSM 8431]SFU28354.1 peptidoglycan-N-acetylmuramic acid deacetylase [Clostridium sp. DSM 8431]